MINRLLPFLLVSCLTPTLWAEPAKARGPFAAQLARECDDLLETVVKRPYGWAWGQAADDDPRKAQLKIINVSLEPLDTPSAGLVLWNASRLLNEPKYAEAARQVARGIAASQQPLGKFPSQASFGATTAGNKEELAPLPNRASTRACLALLLTISEGMGAQQSEALHRAASRAASWLLKQQAESGGWPALYPPNAAVKDASRLIRLDTPDTRDNVIAMLLAYDVMGDPFHRRAAERSVEFLTRVRIKQPGDAGAGAWQSAYTLSGQPVENIAEFPAAYDTLASRHAVQSIFAVYIMLGDGNRLLVCEQAGKSLDQLVKSAEGRWYRRYNLKGGAFEGAEVKPTFIPAGDPLQVNDFGFTQLMNTVSDARIIGREKFHFRLRASFAPREHLAQALAGLSQGPMLLDFPTSREEVEGFVKRYEQALQAVQAPPAESFAARIQRLWIVYLRAKLEAIE